MFGIHRKSTLPPLTLFVSAVHHCCSSQALARSLLDVALRQRVAMKITTEEQAVQIIKDSMIQYDPRFPNQNQTRYVLELSERPQRYSLLTCSRCVLMQ
jgi:hypothetical protein